MLSGVTHAELSRRYGVAGSTITRDVAAVVASWRLEARRDYEEMLGREIAILDTMDRQCADQIDTLLAHAYEESPDGKLTIHGEILGLAREWLGERRRIRQRVGMVLGLNRGASKNENVPPARFAGPIEPEWRPLPDDTESKAEAARLLLESGLLAYEETDEPDEETE